MGPPVHITDVLASKYFLNLEIAAFAEFLQVFAG
jgi:hypothetical protein